MGPGAAQGFNQFRQADTNQDYMRAITAQILAARLRQQQQQAARAGAGNVLYGMIGAPPGVNRGPQPPDVGQASQPRAPAAPVGAPPVPAYQAVPTPPAGGDGGGAGGAPEEDGGEIPPPPEVPAAAAPAPAAGPGTAIVPAGAPAPRQDTGQQINVRGFIGQMKQNGVPPQMALDMLDAVAPRLNDQSQMDIKLLGIENKAIQLARDYALKEVDRIRKERDTAVKEGRAAVYARDVESKIADRKARNDIKERDLQRKLSQHVGGGADNLKRTEFEKDADGNIIGVTGITKSGKIVRLDADGNERARGGTPANPKGDTNRLRQVNSWRSQLSTLLNITSPTPADKTEIERLKKNLRDAGQSDRVPGPGPRAPGAPGPKAPGAIPARPPGVPPGSMYSPSRKQWKSPDDRLFNEAGAPVA